MGYDNKKRKSLATGLLGQGKGSVHFVKQFTKAGLHYTYVGLVERGESNISFDNIVKIADALEIPLKELFTFPINDQPITEIERLRAEIAALFVGKDYEKLKLSLRVLNAIFEKG